MAQTPPRRRSEADVGVWDAALGGMEPVASRFRVVTWNVWFDDLRKGVRQEALMLQTLEQRPDAICLQEVTASFQETLMASSKLMALYNVSPNVIRGYGTLILVRRDWGPVEWQELTDVPTDQGRTIVVAAFRDIVLATVHLESLDSQLYRRAQLERWARFHNNTAKKSRLLILCGDYNFDDLNHWGWWIQSRRTPSIPLENGVLKEVLPSYSDVWSLLRGKERGLTFDGRRNPNVRTRGEQMRYDRILASSPTQTWQPTAINILGVDPIDDTGIRPSDHYGLVADFVPVAEAEHDDLR